MVNAKSLLAVVLLGISGVKADDGEPSGFSLLLKRNENMSNVFYSTVKYHASAWKEAADTQLDDVQKYVQSLTINNKVFQNTVQISREKFMYYYDSFNSILTQTLKEMNASMKYIADVEKVAVSEATKAAVKGMEYCQKFWTCLNVPLISTPMTPSDQVSISPKTVIAAYYFNLNVTELVQKHVVNGTFKLPAKTDCNGLFTNPLRGEYKPIVVVWVAENGCILSRAFKQDVVDKQGGFILWNE